LFQFFISPYKTAYGMVYHTVAQAEGISCSPIPCSSRINLSVKIKALNNLIYPFKITPFHFKLQETWQLSRRYRRYSV